MTLKDRADAFAAIGGFLNRHFGSGERIAAEAPLHEGLDQVIALAHRENNWFVPNFVNHALRHLATQLTPGQIALLARGETTTPRTVAVVCAGNIPLVGWHDILCILLSGHRVLVKPSTDDQALVAFFLRLLTHFSPALEPMIAFARGRLSAFDAVIATGGNNTAQHFRHYFGKYPNIIRQSRTSVAVLTGDESDDELRALGSDIFLYFGLGCRNVGKLLVPAGYSFNRFFEAMLPHGDVINNNKYGNNYDYHRALFLLEGARFLDNNFLLLRESDQLHAPVSVLYYAQFESPAATAAYIDSHRHQLQCVVGRQGTPFGYSQQPVITEFADGIDTYSFLVNL